MFAQTPLYATGKQIPEEALSASTESGARVSKCSGDQQECLLLCKIVGEPLGFDGQLTGFFKTMCSFDAWNGFSSTCSGDLHPYFGPHQQSLPQLMLDGAGIPISYPVIPLCIPGRLGFSFLFPSLNFPPGKAYLQRTPIDVCMPFVSLLSSEQ